MSQAPVHRLAAAAAKAATANRGFQCASMAAPLYRSALDDFQHLIDNSSAWEHAAGGQSVLSGLAECRLIRSGLGDDKHAVQAYETSIRLAFA